MSVRTLTIDGRMVSALADETILDAAREHGIRIPTLCHLDGLQPTGSCRLCLVEVEGSPRLTPACITAVGEGMVVRTHSEQLDGYRRAVLEMLLAERNHVCSVCVANGHCELQSLASELGIDHLPFEPRWPLLSVDASHERFVLDHNRCVLCLRCVRVCDEIEGAHTWDVMNRGCDTRVIIDMNQPWADSTTCTGCGKCVHVCPTGALFEKGKPIVDASRDIDFLTYLKTAREKKLWIPRPE